MTLAVYVRRYDTLALSALHNGCAACSGHFVITGAAFPNGVVQCCTSNLEPIVPGGAHGGCGVGAECGIQGMLWQDRQALS
jgi:hypothetical protein